MSRSQIMAQLREANEAITSATVPRSVLPLLNLDLTIAQLKVLTVLVTTSHGATGQSLAADFEVSMASMSGMLDRLVAHGVAERNQDPEDLRVRRVRATDLGRQVVRELVSGRPELADDILQRLSVPELQALATGMSAIARELHGEAHPEH